MKYSVSDTGLYALLASLDENTPDTPYEVEITTVRGTRTIGDAISGSGRYVKISFGEQAQESLKSRTDAGHMFDDCPSLVSIDASGFTSVTDARYMFRGCSSLVSIDASGFTSVTNAYDMFRGCSSLVSIDASGFTSVTTAYEMFRDCSSLVSIDASGFTSVTTTRYMFRGCSSLVSIDASGFTSVTYADYMFSGCSSLETVNNWKVPRDASMGYCFENCPNLKAIYAGEILPPCESESWHAWSVKRRTDGTAAVSIFNTDGSLKASATVPCNADTICTIHGKCDELTFLENNEISDSDIAKMMKTRYPITADEGCLDPSVSNFVIWADPNSAVKSNIMSDIELSDYDFNDIFGGE